MKRTPTPEQKAAAAARREKFRTLAKQVATLTQEQRQELINRHGAIVTVEGRSLSPVNSVLLIHQFETVSMVGGFQQWIRAGRAVRKGERGLSIWIPARQSNAEPSAEDLGSSKPNFISGTVFDISQTDELPAETEPRTSYRTPEPSYLDTAMQLDQISHEEARA